MTQETKVSLRGLYKIFGNDDKSVLPHVKDGMGKEELLTSHKHVLGLRRHQRRNARRRNHGGDGPVGLGQIHIDPPSQSPH
jgi:hypothetical protein